MDTTDVRTARREEPLPYRSYFRPCAKLTEVSAGWLAFNDDYDVDLAEYEGYIYRGSDGELYIGTYHQDVGLVRYEGPFATITNARLELHRRGFEDYSG